MKFGSSRHSSHLRLREQEDIFERPERHAPPSNNPVAATETSGRPPGNNCARPASAATAQSDAVQGKTRAAQMPQTGEQACIGFVRHVPIVSDDSTPTCNLWQSCVPSPAKRKRMAYPSFPLLPGKTALRQSERHVAMEIPNVSEADTECYPLVIPQPESGAHQVRKQFLLKTVTCGKRALP